MSSIAPEHPLRILLVEDHQDIAENIADYFEARDHVLDFALNGVQGLHLALTEDYDAMILDIMLPGMDGLTLCRTLRQSRDRHTPILMLTARDTLPDKVLGFETGADDYLVKPFELKELEMRIYAMVKRSRPDPGNILKIADLTFNTRTREVLRHQRRIELNRACLCILELLMQTSPAVVTRKELEYALWKDMPPGSDSLRSHMYMLRKKIDKPFSFPLIHTVHKVGYKLAVNHEIPS